MTFVLVVQRKSTNYDEVVFKLDDIASKIYRHPAPRPGDDLELLLQTGNSRQELQMSRCVCCLRLMWEETKPRSTNILIVVALPHQTSKR